MRLSTQRRLVPCLLHWSTSSAAKTTNLSPIGTTSTRSWGYARVSDRLRSAALGLTCDTIWMQTPYNSSNPWTFQAEKRDGCVYLNVKRTQEDLENARNVHENQRRGAYAGRRFEIYSTHEPASSASANGARDEPQRRIVNEDEEFCGIFLLTIGDKRLAVAAEIDCFDDSDGQYLELKTFRLLQRDKDQFVFERFKLLAFWIQSYMVGVPRIVCGFRNDEFEICKIQTFETTQIPSFCRKHWVSARPSCSFSARKRTNLKLYTTE